MAAYAAHTYTATGGQTDFNIGWPYLADSHVKLRINSVASTAFTLVSGGTVLRLNSGATNGDEVYIYRDTPTDSRLVDFESGAGLPEEDLDTAFNQVFYALEEFLFNTDVDEILAAVEDVSEAAAAAAASEAAAELAETNAETAETAAEAAQAAAEATLGLFDTTLTGDAGKAVVVNNGETGFENRKSTSSAVSGGALIDGVFFKAFIGDELPITVNGNNDLAWTHQLGGTPDIVKVYLVCDAGGGDAGYANDTVIDAAGVMGGHSSRVWQTTVITATTITVHTLSESDLMALVTSANASSNLDESKWNVKVVAIRFIVA